MESNKKRKNKKLVRVCLVVSQCSTAFPSSSSSPSSVALKCCRKKGLVVENGDNTHTHAHTHTRTHTHTHTHTHLRMFKLSKQAEEEVEALDPTFVDGNVQ